MTDSPQPDKFDNAAFTMIEQIRKRIWKDLHATISLVEADYF